MSQIETMVEGFRRFRAKYYGQGNTLLKQLASRGQSPKAIVVGCCDSRVDPAIVLDCDPGDLFSIRNVANLVPPHETAGAYHGTSAALEFGVRHLGVDDVIVLGHAHCGGIRALMESKSETDAGGFISGWMQVASHARNRVLARMHGRPLNEMAQACEQEAILVSLDNLLTFPWILERVAAGKLRLHGWYFDIEQGRLLHYDRETNRFQPFD